MAKDSDPFARSALMQPALRRIGFAVVALVVLWLCVLWSVSLA